MSVFRSILGINNKPHKPKPPVPQPQHPSPVITKPMVKKFIPDGPPAKVFKHQDNGVTTVTRDGKVFIVNGDGFHEGRKYGTLIYRLPADADPMHPWEWKFIRGTEGKCYGAVSFKDQLYLLQSDKGSVWQGTQNCRIWNVHEDKRSNGVLQQLRGRGVNWFVINKGPGHMNSYQSNTIDIGCMDWYEKRSAAVKTPVHLFRGDPRDLNSFKFIGIAAGLNGIRNNHATTCSITYIPERKQYIAYLGDWTESIIYQFITQTDMVTGPYYHVRTDKFQPPMSRHHLKEHGHNRITGVFTGNLFRHKGQWYRVVSGHGDSSDDHVYIQKVKGV